MSLRETVYARETDDPVLVLVEISHDDLTAGPLRYVENTEDITSGGISYEGRPMQVTLPDERDRLPSGRLVIGSVDPEIGAALLDLDAPATVRLRVVLASDPDVVRNDYGDMELRDVAVPMNEIRARAATPDLSTEPFPAGLFSPAAFPGVF